MKQISAHEMNWHRRRARYFSALLPIDVYAWRKMSRRDSARHEAGHVVACLALGGLPWFTCIGRTSVGDDGITLFGGAVHRDPMRAAIVAMAGVAVDGADRIGVADADTFLRASGEVLIAPPKLYAFARNRAERIVKRHAAAIDAVASGLEASGFLYRLDVMRLVRVTDPGLRRVSPRKADRDAWKEQGEHIVSSILKRVDVTP